MVQKSSLALKTVLVVYGSGTQVDPNLICQNVFDAEFVNEQGDVSGPSCSTVQFWGSFERFIGMLIEHYAGWMPVWFAPQQVVVMNITDNQAPARQKSPNNWICRTRVITDLRNEKIGFKIRERTLERIPYMIVMGDKEVESNQVNVRTRERWQPWRDEYRCLYWLI